MLIRVKAKNGVRTDSEEIEVALCGKINKKIKVNTFDTISKLTENMNDSKNSIIYNGMVLNPSLSFGFYGITNGDLLHIIERRNRQIGKRDDTDFGFDEMEYRFLLRHVKSSGSFRETDPSVRNEAVRLVDLSFNKLVYRPTSYRRMCNIFNKTLSAISQEIEENNNTVLPEKAETPSTSYLPLTKTDTDAQSD